MDFRHYLYQHIRSDSNEIFYIGVGTKSEKSRKSHKREYSRAYSKGSRNNFWHNVVSHTDYTVEILMESDDYDVVKQLEVALVALYGRRNLGKGELVNLTDGGDGSVNTIVTTETRQKLSASHIGYKHSEDAKKRIGDSNRGRKYTPEQILNYKRAGLERNHSNAVVLLDYLTGVYYDSINDASRIYGISSSFLWAMLKGEKRNSTSLIYAESKENSSYAIIPEIKPYKPFIVTDEYRKNLSNKLKGVHSGSKNGQAKKVINILTGKIYLCAKDACEDSEYNYPYFTQMISSKTKTRNKTPFEYYDEEKHAHLLNKQ